MLESTLERMAEKILALDEASLSALWLKYKNRMDDFDASKEWEKAVIVLFIINAVRAKNHIFNEQILKEDGRRKDHQKSPKTKPDLKRIK